MQCSCGADFEPYDGKPGLVTQCRECGLEEERNRGIDRLIASQGDNINGWSLMPASKFFTVKDVASRDYGDYMVEYLREGRLPT